MYWLRNKVRSCWHSGGKYNRQMYVSQRAQIFIQKDLENNILTAR